MNYLRFEKNGNESFEPIESLTILDLFDFIKDTNKHGKITNVITNSAEFGLIPQNKFFDKEIAVQGNTSKYTVIKKGDFVYNPRKSSIAPYGPFNCYNLEEVGIVSPLYSCLRPKYHELTPYLLYYFESPAWYSYIYYNGNQGGARHDRVGMTKDLLNGIPIGLPSKEERDKIVAFFKLIDNKISSQTKKLQSLEERKKAILHDIFAEIIKFKDKEGRDYPEWEKIMLSDILEERKEKSKGNEEVFSVSVSKGLINQIEHLGRSFAADDTSKYKVVSYGDIVYTKSPTGDFKWGIVKQSLEKKNVIVSPLYGIFIPKSMAIGGVLDAYFSSNIRCHNYLITQIRKGAKNTINITNDEFLNKEIKLPQSEEEAQKICDLYELLNNQILLEENKLDSLKVQKKTLLKQMFSTDDF